MKYYAFFMCVSVCVCEHLPRVLCSLLLYSSYFTNPKEKYQFSVEMKIIQSLYLNGTLFISLFFSLLIDRIIIRKLSAI